MSKIKLSKRLKYGTMALVFTLVFVAAIIVVNVLLSLATDKLGLELDMTSDKRFQLSEATEDLINGLKTPLTMYVLAAEGSYKDLVATKFTAVVDNAYRSIDFGDVMEELLKKYELDSGGKIDVQFIDTLKNPAFLSKYKFSDTITEGSVIVDNGQGVYRLILIEDLFYWENYSDRFTGENLPVGINLERSLASAIGVVESGTQTAKPKALFLTGKGETDANNFVSLLSFYNYEILQGNLAMGDIPEDVQIVVLNSPTMDYSYEELEKLGDFLNGRYGTLIVTMSPGTKKLPELELFLRDYGVVYEQQIIYDKSQSIDNNAENIVVGVNTELDLFNTFDVAQSLISMGPSRPISKIENYSGGWTVDALLASTESSFSKVINPDIAIEFREKEAGDIAGPFITAAWAYKTSNDMEDPRQANVLLLSSSDVIGDAFISRDALANEEFMSLMLTTFSGSKDLTRYKAKTFESAEFTMLDSEKTTMLAVSVCASVLFLLCGIVVWVRRKNL